MFNRFLLFLFITLTLFSCKGGKYLLLDDGILILPDTSYSKDTKQVKIRVVSDRIFQILASPKDSIISASSLITVEQVQAPVKWKVREQGDRVFISTEYLTAGISLKTGEIVFTDSLGNVLLKEKQGGGKSFNKQPHSKSQDYSICQEFESPAEEAIYGLGQHQDGILNYKGRDEELYQYNSKVAIPFMVSSKNYGLLWDNYSYSTFGDKRTYNQLSQFILSDPKGNEGSLTATYVDREASANVFATRNESGIDYEFIGSAKKFPGNVQLSKSKVIWSGNIQSQFDGPYKFRLYYSGYIKVWINGKLITDRWRQAWNPSLWFWEFEMVKGQKYPVNIEWIPDGDEAYLSLKALPALPEQERSRITLSSETGVYINYYFICGNNMDEVIKGYREVTGRAPILPKWAFGFWQSRERYKTQDEVLSVVKEFRKRKIPLDNIVLDWFYWKEDQWGSHEFDRSRFPDPGEMVTELHEKLNTHIILSVWPKFYVGTEHFNEFESKGWLYKKNVTDKQKDWVGPGYVSTFYDAFNPSARQLFWKQIHEHLYTKKFDGWWLDATEPDILSNSSLENRKALMDPTSLGPASKYFNAYSLMNARGIYEGQRSADPDKRIFILTRSAFAGQQRYGTVTWSGDIGTRWEDYKAQISAGLNFSLSGLPYWTMDIGGFSVEKRYEHASGSDLEEWLELNTRWFQFGAFCPVFRVHGQYPYREMFNLASETTGYYQSMLYYDKLRYRLMPYIYSMAGNVYHNDYTIMRALVMDFPGDTRVFDISDQFMFGPDILVAPVYEFKARTRNLYLPSGCGWYDMYTGEYVNGGILVKVLAPLEKIPLFAKEGSVIPFGPEIQYTDEKPADTIRLYIYAGANGHFEYYEDEGINNNYEKGMYSVIPISYSDQNHTLTLDERRGSFPGMLDQRTFEVVVVMKDKPAGLDFNTDPDKVISYEGKKVTVNLQ